jgi:fructoselysine 6-phosphate deglycase
MPKRGVPDGKEINALNELITRQVEAAVAAMASKENVENVYLVACGGSFALMQPVKYVFDHESATIVAHELNANEFIHRNPKALGERSIVIAASHSGTTPETVAAAEFGRSHGALTIAITNDAESPLAKAADAIVTYEHGQGIEPINGSAAVLYRLAFGLLAAKESNEKAALLTPSLVALQGVIAKARERHAEDAVTWGQSYKKEPLIYTMASGSNFGTAYSFAICLLQEMQWVHSAAIHAGEYFHGPFEITDADVPFIVLVGAGETRPLDERAVAFVQEHSSRVLTIDANDFEFGDVDPSLAGYLSEIVFGAVLRQYADALADHRGHPLSVRRYMWRMEY